MLTVGLLLRLGRDVASERGRAGAGRVVCWGPGLAGAGQVLRR